MSKLTDLASKFYDLRQEKSSLALSLKELEAKLKAVEKEMLEELCHEGMTRVDIKGKGSFFTSSRRFYKISDKDAFMDFIHEQGDTDLLSVQAQTLNAYANELNTRKEAEGIKDYIVPGLEYVEKPSIKLRKTGNSDNESEED